jgi:putative SOS response-associated peptidase YedK
LINYAGDQTLEFYNVAPSAPDAHDGFVFISADSKGGVVGINDWQPVALNPDLAREWLNPTTSEKRAEQIMLLQWEPPEAFEWFKVARAIGNLRNQQSGLTNPSDPLI